MKQEHFDEFCELLDTVAEQYSKAMTPGLKMLYWQGLYDIDFEAVREALFRHIRNADPAGKFMPKISDIIQMSQGSASDSAMSAWAKVDKAVRHKGTYVDVVFDDPVIHRVIHDMGGWISFGQKNEDEWPFVAREFENRYRGFKQRSEVPDYPTQLIGLTNAYNSSKGFKLDPCVLVGEVDKCRKVLAGGTNKPLIGFTQVEIKNDDFCLGNDNIKKLKSV